MLGIFCAHCVLVTLCIVHIGLCCPLAAPGAPGTCGCRPQEMPPCPRLPNVTSSPDFTQTCAYFMQCLNFTYPAQVKSSPDFTQICAYFMQCANITYPAHFTSLICTDRHIVHPKLVSPSLPKFTSFYTDMRLSFITSVM